MILDITVEFINFSDEPENICNIDFIRSLSGRVV